VTEPVESPAPPPRRDVRVVTPEHLEELRRDQQETYRALRRRGFGPPQAAREVGIPRSLAETWEEPDAPGTPIPGVAEDLESRTAEILQLRQVYREACEAARRARAYTVQLERDVAAVREHLYRLESAGGTTSAATASPVKEPPATAQPEPPASLDASASSSASVGLPAS
jgi:hypothetical protein